MKTALMVISALCFASNAFAWDTYAVQRDDGVSVVYYNPGSQKSLDQVLKDSGLEGKPVKKISKDDLPSREDRAFWVFNDVPVGKKIKVDTVKKQAEEAKKAAEEAERNAVLEKLKISKEELEKVIR